MSHAISVTLPLEVERFVRDEVARGYFGDENEVIVQALQALRLDAAVRDALSNEEGLQSLDDAYDEAMNDPTSGIPIDEVAARLRRMYAEDTKSVA